MQVDAVATSLNSYDCFVLQSGNTVFMWNGSSSTHEQQQWVDQTAEFLKPGATLKHCKEGTESSAFWFALGGKQNFSSKKSTQDVVRDPHLYTFTFKQGRTYLFSNFQVIVTFYAILPPFKVLTTVFICDQQ
ncbi:villin-3-like [Zingiber officinale]|uniref:villin-3-like n=1 Tax=Zingiber officinale TaxID=94328 RepID=UPI001C4ADFC6|nr:villin-3-like [Zingiber officinale]